MSTVSGIVNNAYAVAALVSGASSTDSSTNSTSSATLTTSSTPAFSVLLSSLKAAEDSTSTLLGTTSSDSSSSIDTNLYTSITQLNLYQNMSPSLLQYYQKNFTDTSSSSNTTFPNSNTTSAIGTLLDSLA